MLHLISQDIKAIARRTLGEIFPRGPAAKAPRMSGQRNTHCPASWRLPSLPELSAVAV